MVSLPSGGRSVMQSRHEAHDSLEFFPTQPWATRALCEQMTRIETRPLGELTVLEPACGTGDMARPLAEYFKVVEANDVHDYGYGEVDDFLLPGDIGWSPDWIITNPPFRLAEQFIAAASRLATRGWAMLVRTSFLEGVGRHRDLFSVMPPTHILQFTERVPMFKGRLDRTGSTATSYCWLVWALGWDGTTFGWIPPCRKRLERDEDYVDA